MQALLTQQNITILVTVIAFLGAILVLFGKSGSDFVKKPLLTGNEKEFFGRLKRALPDYNVFPQVAMGAIIDAAEKDNVRKRMSARGRFDRKIIDFVITDRNFEIIALIELDDRTHDAGKDASRDYMTKSAGYRTIRWHSKNKPDEKSIRKTILGG